MSAARRVLIVGGGLSGTSAAIALQREGIEVELIEREPVWSALGTGITLMGPAMRALKQLGVLDQCLAEGAGGSEMQLFNAHGDLVQTLQIHGLLGPDYPAVGGMLRPALHRILASAAAGEGVSVRNGHDCHRARAARRPGRRRAERRLLRVVRPGARRRRPEVADSRARVRRRRPGAPGARTSRLACAARSTGEGHR
ncbi:MAG: FAD-dependent monooxygenase, partial [Solirubrobacteraceae bacterium]